MSLLQTRISALKTAYPDRPHVIHVSDEEAIEYVMEGKDDKAKEAAKALSAHLGSKQPVQHAELVKWIDERKALHRDLWDMLESKVVDDVTITEAR